MNLPSMRHGGSKHNSLVVTVALSPIEITGIFISSYRSMAIIVHCLCSLLFQITVILQLGFLCNALIKTQTYPCIKMGFFFYHLITAFNIIGFLGNLAYVYVILRLVIHRLKQLANYAHDLCTQGKVRAVYTAGVEWGGMQGVPLRNTAQMSGALDMKFTRPVYS